jgi:NADPH2:quinone reductase
MTKAIRFYEIGGPEVLRLEDVPLGAPGPGQVLLRQTAVAVNYREICIRTGLHPVASFPSGVGLESAGVIEAVGPDVGDLAVGDRVFCISGPDGSYAEARIVPAARVVRIPEAIDDRLAAAMMSRGITARLLIHDTYRVRPGDVILVHAAAGGVGTILTQWAKHLGATVIGTVGSGEKAARARACGCDHVIVYTKEDFVKRVREITGGKGVPVVYDSVGRDTFEGSARCLQRRGLLASFGEASGHPDPVPPRRLGQLGSIYLTHPSLADYIATREEFTRAANDLFAMVTSGRIKVEINRTYPLHEASRAHRDLASRSVTGSIVLIP